MIFTTVRDVHIFFHPAGLKPGTSDFIDLIYGTTVFKSLNTSGDEEVLTLLGTGARILQAVRPHKHSIYFKKLPNTAYYLSIHHFGA